MHATNTLDYGILLSGRITLVTETGETKLEPGDLIVDRGVLHGWPNPGPGPAKMLFVNIDAAPVGGGATVGQSSTPPKVAASSGVLRVATTHFAGKPSSGQPAAHQSNTVR